MIEFATARDSAAIDCLLDRSFGPARRSRTAYRLRVGGTPTLQLVVRDGAAIVGSIQLWPLLLREASGRQHAMTLLGPLAVDPASRGAGLGSKLIAAALARVAGPVVLIGDESFYGRFGFSAAATQNWAVPGPIDRARLLARGAAGLPVAASLEPAVDALVAA